MEENLKLLYEIERTNLQRYEMLIDDIENYNIVIGDRTEREIVLNALRYCYNIAVDYQEIENLMLTND